MFPVRRLSIPPLEELTRTWHENFAFLSFLKKYSCFFAAFVWVEMCDDHEKFSMILILFHPLHLRHGYVSLPPFFFLPPNMNSHCWWWWWWCLKLSSGKMIPWCCVFLCVYLFKDLYVCVCSGLNKTLLCVCVYVCTCHVCECVECWKTPVKVGWFPECAHKQWEKKGWNGGGGAGEGHGQGVYTNSSFTHELFPLVRNSLWVHMVTLLFGFLQMCYDDVNDMTKMTPMWTFIP